MRPIIFAPIVTFGLWFCFGMVEGYPITAITYLFKGNKEQRGILLQGFIGWLIMTVILILLIWGMTGDHPLKVRP